MKPVVHMETEPEAVSRITDLLIKQGKTQTELLEYLGLNRNNFTEWKAGRKKSYLLYIDEIARYFDVTPTYLLRGEAEYGLMLSQDEQRLIQMYRILHADSKGKIMATAESLVKTAETFDKSAGSLDKPAESLVKTTETLDKITETLVKPTESLDKPSEILVDPDNNTNGE